MRSASFEALGIGDALACNDNPIISNSPITTLMKNLLSIFKNPFLAINVHNEAHTPNLWLFWSQIGL